MRLKTLFRDSAFFSKQNPIFWKRNLKLSEIENINVHGDAIINHTKNFTSQSFKNPKLKYFMAGGMLTSTAIAYYFWSKPKSSNNFDTESLMKAVYSFQAGDVDTLVVTIAILAKNNNDLKDIISNLESENFYQADQLAKYLFVNKLAQKEMYYFVKGIILSAYAEVQFESDSLAISNREQREISPWYFDAVDCFRKVMQSDKNKELQLLALTHNNRLIKHLKNRYSKAALSSMDEKMASNQPLMTKILIWLQSVGIEKSDDSNKSQALSNFDAVYSKLKPVIKQYCRLSYNPNFQNNNRVTIRIWDRKNGSEVGHVSLETPQYYVSHWNKIELGDRTLLDDIIAYQRLPDTRVSLYTLDVDKIHVTYNNFRRSNCQWDLLASSVLSSMSQKNSQNCSGLTAVLLKVGGVENLASLYWPPFKDLLIDSAIVGAAIFWILISIAGVAGKVECDTVNTRQSPAEVARLIKEALERQKQLTLIKDIFFMLTGLGAGVWGLYSTYNLVFNDIPRLLGYGLVTHPEHIKILVENAKKYEIENIQSDLNVTANKM